MNQQPWDLLVCPRCGGHLILATNALVCGVCSAHWPLLDNIPYFRSTASSHPTDSRQEVFGELLRIAESSGWDSALFVYYTKARAPKVGHVLEDLRTADSLYFLPSLSCTNSTAMVLGCGLGTFHAVLSHRCRRVYVVDTVWEKVAFIDARRKQQGISNLLPACVDSIFSLPFPSECFDLVILRDFEWEPGDAIRLPDLLSLLKRYLKKGGSIFLNLGNRLAFPNLVRRTKHGSIVSLHTIYGYRRMLQDQGFKEIRFYAPLPDHESIPLFYVPLDDSSALRYFLEEVFPLFDMVSPEVKRAYGFPDFFAKVGVRLALALKLTNLMSVFAPGFTILATNA